MKELFIICLSIGLFSILRAQSPEIVKIQVNADKTIALTSKMFNGTNIEDLNNQTNGGIFSQLLHGEAFEESFDIDFLHLPVGNYVKVYVVTDEMGSPNFITQADVYTRINWNNLNEKYDFNIKDIFTATNFRQPWKIGQLRFNTRFIPYDSIPEAIRSELSKRISGNEQISRYWTKMVSGNVSYRYELKRGNAYMGRQNQVIRFIRGEGETGLYNAGLNKQGINLIAGKSYDGILRLKSKTPGTIYLSFRDENGNVLAEKSHLLKGDGSYEKVAFDLTPSGSTPKGRFGIAIRSIGEIELGFVFLQPGEWGRTQGFPVRREFVDALKKQGIKAIRYNGSMVDVGPDTYFYRWKKMIGPVDERRVCYRNGFNLYATHSFGLIELLQVAEAMGAQAMIGMSMDETYEDIRDFVEYVNGPVTTVWGRLRAEHGHPEPYNLKFIEVDNERTISRSYVECMKKFALAAWEADPEMHIVASLNISIDTSNYARGTTKYDLASEIFGWFIKQEKADKIVWDPHFPGGNIKFADNPAFSHVMGIDLQANLAKDYPGHKLTLCPMEENGSSCDWSRGMAHAHNWNTLQRNGNYFKWLGTANTFQPHGQHYMWDQGRIHYTSNEIWFQASAYIDEKMSKEWLPVVVEATSSNDKVLDVTAKIGFKKDSLSIYVLNLSDSTQKAIINVADFRFSGEAKTWLIGDCDLKTLNTVNNKKAVAPKTGTVSFSKKNAAYNFPKFSYTVITLIR